MFSTSRPINRQNGPIYKVPLDILREIFIRTCQYPLLDDEYATTLMTICQVCSAWRGVALTYAPLWAHLKFTFTFVQMDSESPWIVLKEDMELFHWWTEKQGAIAPFLSLSAEFVDIDAVEDTDDFLLPPDGLHMIFAYLTSAQYLDIGSFFWGLMLDQYEEGTQYAFPNLKSLVLPNQDEDAFHAATQILAGYAWNPNSLPPLRNLKMYAMPLQDEVIPPFWSCLTCLSLTEVEIDLQWWHSLIRSVPNLVWAELYVYEIRLQEQFIPPVPYVHPNLVTFLVTYREFECVAQNPLSLIFTNIHFPALRTLELTSYITSWDDTRFLDELGAGLASSPNITTLILANAVLNFDHKRQGASPLWARVPHLSHLQIEFSYPLITIDNPQEIKGKEKNPLRIFNNASTWLAPNDPMCPIGTVTILDDPTFGEPSTAKKIEEALAQQIPNFKFRVARNVLRHNSVTIWWDWSTMFLG